MAERSYRWYIEPLDAHTNKVIAEKISEENFSEEGNLWECKRSFVASLQRSRNTLSLRFNVFVQEGNGAKRPWFAQRRKPKKKK